MEVEAHVVTIKNAAMADDAGLLNPLLKRWQDQACSTMVFGLPAVQSVINFKWDRQALLCSQAITCAEMQRCVEGLSGGHTRPALQWLLVCPLSC